MYKIWKNEVLPMSAMYNIRNCICVIDVLFKCVNGGMCNSVNVVFTSSVRVDHPLHSNETSN